MTKVSIRDVAAYAEVSIATVSRIVNKIDHPISPEARAKVEKAIRELHYVPNRSAQSLRKQTSNGIALIVRNIGNSYFTEIAESVTETAIKNDCLSMVFNSMQDTQYEMRYYDLILRQHFDGVIIAGGGYSGERSPKGLKSILRQLEQQGVRTVALAPQGFEIPSIIVDNEKIGHTLAGHLIERGHTRIAYIGGYEGHIADDGRLKGFRERMARAGLPVDDSLIRRRDFTWQGGYDLCAELLDGGGTFTAVCCSNDTVASGAMWHLKERGLSVPDDVSVIGVGNLMNAAYERPGLTTIKLPFATQGRLAVEKILSGENLDTLHMRLDTELVERESVRTLQRSVPTRS